MGGGKQVGKRVQWDDSSSHGWGDRGAFKEAGADPCSGTCSWPPLETGQMGRYSGPERLSCIIMLSFIFFHAGAPSIAKCE